MNTQAIEKKIDEYMETATPEQVVKEFKDSGVEFVQIEGPVEILKKYGAIPTDWRHCLQELDEYYNVEEQLEQQKVKTAQAMLTLFKILIQDQGDATLRKGLLQTIKKYENELDTKV